SRAGERAFAGTFDVDLVAVRDLEHGKAERCVDLAMRAVAFDKSHFGHYGLSGLGTISSARIAAASAGVSPLPRSAAVTMRSRSMPAASLARNSSAARAGSSETNTSTACVTGRAR